MYTIKRIVPRRCSLKEDPADPSHGSRNSPILKESSGDLSGGLTCLTPVTTSDSEDHHSFHGQGPNPLRFQLNLALFADGVLLTHRHHHVIEYILEGKEECSSDSTLSHLGANT